MQLNRIILGTLVTGAALAIGVGAVIARQSPTGTGIAAPGATTASESAHETTPDVTTPTETAGADRTPAPALAGADPVHGGTFALASTIGRPTVVLVWASWCPECNAEAPTVTALAKAHPEVAFVGVDLRDDGAGAKAYYKRHGWTFPSIDDPDGSLTAALGVPGQPSAIFLDARGRIVGRLVGRSGAEAFEAGIKASV